jgi:DNA polymerase I
MLVGRSRFPEFLKKLDQVDLASVDCETTGLRPYHGDRLFSIIFGIPEGEKVHAYYLNFLPYSGVEAEWVLTPTQLEQLKPVFKNPARKWYAHNAKFDVEMLAQEGIEIAGTIHCTQSAALVLYNEHQSYTLEACAARIGFKKDDAVERYILEHGLTEKRQGATQAYTHKFFDRVPFDIIVPYGETDARITYSLGQDQEAAIAGITFETEATLPPVQNILENERRLTRTVIRMERAGLRVDLPYCLRAAQYEADRAERAQQAFRRSTGRDLINSGKLFADVFTSERERWGYTEKGNPSFESDILKRFEHPAAKDVLEFRDAKSKRDFYQGFIYHADSQGFVHPSFNQDGAATGRFSSSSPNFQNLTSEEDEDQIAQEFVVRRAIIPRPGHVLVMLDYDQVEYRMMFDYACRVAGREMEIVRKIKHEGLDPHQATADVVTALGFPLARKKAKNGNFAILYGSGDKTLAATIKCPVAEARELRQAIYRASPELRTLVNEVMGATVKRGYIRNWAGRRCYFPDPRFAYKAPNYLIQGGAADVTKFAMNRIDEYLQGKRSLMIATIHDELVFDCPESEAAEVGAKAKEIMESVFPWKYLPLTCGAEHSTKSLGDKVKGLPA